MFFIIDQLMEKLKKQLYKEFPARHYQHTKIFMAYWRLIDLINECKPIKKR